MSFGYIQQYYGVPAKKGQRVEWTSGVNPPRKGTIVGFHNQYLRIHFDGDAKRHPGVFHATDNMRYLDAE